MQLLILIILSSSLLFVIPKRFKWHLAYLLQLTAAVLTSWYCVNVLNSDSWGTNIEIGYFWGRKLFFVIDKLSAFFILVINITALTAGAYAREYLKPYKLKKTDAEMALHYFSFIWLQFSMILVCTMREGMGFLISWELMSISSFLLVMFESDRKETVKIAINYLIQMHIGVAFIISAFLLSSDMSVTSFGFNSLEIYFMHHRPWFIFSLFFIGFGIKAGFIPFHSWLPHAHPAAPSHVSAVMSGVMLKMGIFGILRVLHYIHTDLIVIGGIVLIFSLVSGLMGIIYAIVQRDLKKMLAYSSIENIGIIGTGIGLGIIGMAMDLPVLTVFCFTGALLHVLNHSLFKSLLFFTAGSVYFKTHSRDMEELGGVSKRMPYTANLFLIASLAICGLPPLNGFTSEFLIYIGLFNGLQSASLGIDFVILASLLGLVLIGGLAVYAFTRSYSIVFLGNPRSGKVDGTKDPGAYIVMPEIIIAVLLLIIGLFPFFFAGYAYEAASLFTSEVSPVELHLEMLRHIGLAGGVLILIVALLLLIRRRQQKRVGVKKLPTWGCAYTGGDPRLHQYTGNSYSSYIQELAGPLLKKEEDYQPIKEQELFPARRNFAIRMVDLFENFFIRIPSRSILDFVKRSAILQTGMIQHYMLYALLFISLLFLLTVLNLI